MTILIMEMDKYFSNICDVLIPCLGNLHISFCIVFQITLPDYQVQLFSFYRWRDLDVQSHGTDLR